MKRARTRLAKLLEERDTLLEVHPELKPTQKKWEKTVEKEGEDVNRRTEALLSAALTDYGSELNPLKSELESIQSLIKDLNSQRTKRKKGGK